MIKMTFVTWLENELNNHSWSRADLARRAGINPSALSHIYSSRRKPGVDICEAIAKALHLPAEEVFRHAGLLPPVPELDRLQEKMLYLFNTLTDPEDKQRAIEFIEFIKSKEDEQIKAKTVST